MISTSLASGLLIHSSVLANLWWITTNVFFISVIVFFRSAGFFSFKKIEFIYLFLERGGRGEKEREETLMCERNIDGPPLACTLTRDLACNPGMCPDKESNQQHFTLWNNTQPTEPHQSGLLGSLLLFLYVEIIPKFLYFTLKFGEHAYNHFFEFFYQVNCLLCFIRVFFWRFFLFHHLRDIPSCSHFI